MSFLSFSVKNPFRNKLRTIFVIIFLIIGILAITSSMALSHVSTQIFDANFNIGGANLNILGDKYLSSNDLNTIKNIDGVQNAVGVSIYTLNSENDTKYGFNSFSGKALVNDSDIEGIGHIKLVTGRFINSENEIILTRDAAKTIGKKIGDEFKVTEISSLISINSSSNLRKKEIKEDLKVVGIIDNLPNNQSGILQMSHINWLLFNSSELKFNSISIKTKNGQFEQVKNTLNQTYPQFIVIDGNALISVLKDIFLYITLLFISIGTIIIMIATLKSVNERTREIEY
jgi:putative ABC transport system permease protein